MINHIHSLFELSFQHIVEKSFLVSHIFPVYLCWTYSILFYGFELLDGSKQTVFYRGGDHEQCFMLFFLRLYTQLNAWQCPYFSEQLLQLTLINWSLLQSWHGYCPIRLLPRVWHLRFYLLFQQWHHKNVTGQWMIWLPGYYRSSKQCLTSDLDAVLWAHRSLSAPAPITILF